MISTYKKHKENETYQLVPGPDYAQNWHIRILEGNFIETVIEVGTISFNESNCIIYYGLYDIQDIEEIIAEPEIKL